MFDMRFPVLSKEGIEALKDLVETAKKPENWFDGRGVPSKADIVRTNIRPGAEGATMVRHVTAKITHGYQEEDVTYRVCFTATIGMMGHSMADLKPVMVRHASIGVDSMERPLDQTEIITMAVHLGFSLNVRGKTEKTHHPDLPLVTVLAEPFDEKELKFQEN